MKLKNPKKFILSLLLDDLMCSKLMADAEAYKLNPLDYSMDMADKVVMLMGFRGKQNELVYEYYLGRREYAKHIKTADGNAQMKAFAKELYKELDGFKR